MAAHVAVRQDYMVVRVGTVYAFPSALFPGNRAQLLPIPGWH